MRFVGKMDNRLIAPPSVLPDISPSRGEIAPWSQLSPISGVANRPIEWKLPISPLEGASRTEGGENTRTAEWREQKA